MWTHVEKPYLRWDSNPRTQDTEADAQPVADDTCIGAVGLRTVSETRSFGLHGLHGLMLILHCWLILQPHSSRLCRQTTQPYIILNRVTFP